MVVRPGSPHTRFGMSLTLCTVGAVVADSPQKIGVMRFVGFHWPLLPSTVVCVCVCSCIHQVSCFRCTVTTQQGNTVWCSFDGAFALRDKLALRKSHTSGPSQLDWLCSSIMWSSRMWWWRRCLLLCPWQQCTKRKQLQWDPNKSDGRLLMLPIPFTFFSLLNKMFD